MVKNNLDNVYILTLACPDKLGLVNAVSGFLLEQKANIEEAAQYNDPRTGLFFMRVQFFCDDKSHQELKSKWGTLANSLNMTWSLNPKAHKMRTIIMVSKEGHCLNDLLFRWKSGLLPIDIKAVISNHRDFYQLAASYNIPFYHTPMSENKSEVESNQLKIIEKENTELVILARYMQILSDNMCQELSGRAINIHHSFLPSFKGAKPYHQAFEKGVKLIGATAHYVTADLDEGPIIEQEVSRVDHSKTASELVNMGKDTENIVLARAVKWHSEHRIILNGSKTVIFR